MKKILLLVLSITLLFTSSVFANSANNTEKNNKSENFIEKNVDGITFKISKKYSQLITNEDLESIAKDYQEEEILITIEEIGYAEEDSFSKDLIEPMWGVGNTYETTYGAWGSEYVKKDAFVTSVAKGESYTLTSEIKINLNASYTGTPYVPITVGADITATYIKSHTFEGPEETSFFNSREFRVKFYEKSSNWTQKWYMDGFLVGTKTGIRTSATKYLKYSVDRNIQ